MQELEERIIELSKVKIFLLLIGCILFVVLGAWLLTQNEARPFIGGILSIVVFGFFGIVYIKKLFVRSPGLILNSDGIIDNSSGAPAGFIPWSEVENIGQYQIQKQKIISIYVQDPGKYTARGNVLQRIANKGTLKISGTPINIVSNGLKISHKELNRN